MIDELVREARAAGVRPWIAIKEKLAARVIEVVGSAGADAVLQGGAALHFVYGSPRLSADGDFVGRGLAATLTARGDELARAAHDLLGLPAHWVLRRRGRLLRGKITVQIDAARRLALPVEGYQVQAHRTHQHARYGAVEQPAEIAADKIVATADRLERRGTLKATDLYDLWFVRTQLGLETVDTALVALKARDYQVSFGARDLGRVVLALPAEELAAALQGVLPSTELEGLDCNAIIALAADTMRRATP